MTIKNLIRYAEGMARLLQKYAPIVFGSISEINSPVEIIDVFRPSNEAIAIAKEAVKINAKVLWLQLDIKSEEAKKSVEENNILYIDNKCTKIEFEKYFN